MADELQKLEIQVKVNAETKQLEIVNTQLAGTAEKIKVAEANAKKAGGSHNEFAEAIKKLSEATGINIPLITGWASAIVTVGKVLKDSVENAQAEILRQKQLKASLQGLGIEYDKYKESIEKTTESLATLTRFTRDETFDAFNRALKITGSVEGAYKLLKISMDVAVGTGKNLNQVMDTFNIALRNPTIGTRALATEFGKLGVNGKDVNEMITNLGNVYKNASINEQSLAKETSKLRQIYDDLTQSIGMQLIPVLKDLLGFLKTPFTILATIVNIAMTGVLGYANVIINAMKSVFNAIRGHWDEAVKDSEEMKKAYFKMGADIEKSVKGAWDNITKDQKANLKEVEKAHDVHLNTIVEKQEKAGKKQKKDAKDTTDDIKKEYENMIKTITKNVESTLAGGFEKAAQKIIEDGKITDENLKIVFTDIYQAFRDMLIKMAAEMAARAAMFSILNLISGGTGSIGGFAIKELLGGFQVGGEVPVTGAYVLHKGEKVIPPGTSSITNDNKNVSVNLNVNAFDLRTLDKIQIQRIANQIAPYIKKEMH